MEAATFSSPLLKCRRGTFKLPVAAATGARGAAFVPQTGAGMEAPGSPARSRRLPREEPGAEVRCPRNADPAGGAQVAPCAESRWRSGAEFPGSTRPREASN